MSVYSDIGSEVGSLVASKQKMYGDSFGHAGNVMRELYPNGISLDQMDDALTVVRIIDKLFRISHGSQGDESPYGDICGYAILALNRQLVEKFGGTTTH